MGTRHIVAVQVNGEYKLAQYGQWDGYPDGQGLVVLDFLKNGDIEALKRNLGKTYLPTKEEYAELWSELGVDIDQCNGIVPYNKSNIFADKHPSLHRNTGGRILGIVAESNAEKIPITHNIKFAADSLFCEWAYVIDFDLGVFEVYKGFNKEPVPADSRFAQFTPDEQSGYDTTYYQVALMQTWTLSALPSKDQFLEALGYKFDTADRDPASPD